MASLQKAMSLSRMNSCGSNGSASSVASSRSRQSSLASDVSTPSLTSPQSAHAPVITPAERTAGKGKTHMSRQAPVDEEPGKAMTSQLSTNDDSAFHEEDTDVTMTSDDAESSRSRVASDLNSNDVKVENHNSGTSAAVATDSELSKTNTDTSQAPPASDDVTNGAEAQEEEESEEESDSESEEEDGVPASDGSPVFIKRPRDFTAFDGDSARFDCVISGDPDPDVRWLKDGQPIVVNRRKFDMQPGDGGQRSLVIKYCDVADSATYACRLTNEHGQALSEAKLTVRPMK